MARELSRREKTQAAVRSLQESTAFQAMCEDVWVLKACPGRNSVRAVAAPNGEVWLVSASEQALRDVSDAVERGAAVRARKIKTPDADELAGWIDETIPKLPERSGD